MKQVKICNCGGDKHHHGPGWITENTNTLVTLRAPRTPPWPRRDHCNYYYFGNLEGCQHHLGRERITINNVTLVILKAPSTTLAEAVSQQISLGVRAVRCSVREQYTHTLTAHWSGTNVTVGIRRRAGGWRRVGGRWVSDRKHGALAVETRKPRTLTA